MRFDLCLPDFSSSLCLSIGSELKEEVGCYLLSFLAAQPSPAAGCGLFHWQAPVSRLAFMISLVCVIFNL